MPTQFTYDDVAAKTLSPITRKALAEQIRKDIDVYSVTSLTDEHRHHLGASVIGHECAAFVWFAFRWVKFEIFNGRMLRLFERGNLEETRIIKLLRGIGFKVWEVDPETQKQFRIWGVQGHYGGSADSVGIAPYFPDLPMLLEFKTHNTKSFTNLINKASVVLAKPRHFAQMCSYGKHFGFKFGLYIAFNKNDDDIYPEIVELDWNLAHDLINKAQDIIESKFRPPRISDNPAFYECKYCSFAGICHYNEPVEKNCRSCKMATPVDDAQWHCSRWQTIIPKDAIKKGCEFHVSITT